jgi:hypothetical protein
VLGINKFRRCNRLEAFINELGVLAARALPTDPPTVTGLGSMLGDIEDSRGTTKLKYMAAAIAFRGRTYDKGCEPFQSMELLFRVRDAIVHLKSEQLEFDERGSATWSSHTWVLEKLRSKSVLAEHDPFEYVGTSPTWLSLLNTRAVARWACNVASQIALAALDSIPECDFKRQAEFFYKENFRAIENATNGKRNRGPA